MPKEWAKVMSNSEEIKPVALASNTCVKSSIGQLESFIKWIFKIP